MTALREHDDSLLAAAHRLQGCQRASTGAADVSGTLFALTPLVQG